MWLFNYNCNKYYLKITIRVRAVKKKPHITTESLRHGGGGALCGAEGGQFSAGGGGVGGEPERRPQGRASTFEKLQSRNPSPLVQKMFLHHFFDDFILFLFLQLLLFGYWTFWIHHPTFLLFSPICLSFPCSEPPSTLSPNAAAEFISAFLLLIFLFLNVLFKRILFVFHRGDISS